MNTGTRAPSADYLCGGGGTPCDTCSGGYGACSTTCGTGTQTCTLDQYTANATDDPCTVLHGGAYYVGGACNSEKTKLYQCSGSGSSTSNQNCNCQANSGSADTCNGQIACTQGTSSQTCTGTAPVDGGWSGWSGWSTCSLSCGTGTQTRTRACNNPTPNSCGAGCSGSTSETQNCNTQSCTVIITGQVYTDYNGNGVKDGVDVGKAGVNVSDGVGSDTTDGNGNYSIANVTPGNYTMTISNYGGTGYNITYPSPYPPTVYATNPSNTQNFGIKPGAPICDGGIATANPAQIYVGGNPPPTTSNLSVANCRDGTGALGTVTYAWVTPIQGTISPTNAASVTYFPPVAYSTYTQINVAPSLFVCNPGGAGATCTPYGANLTLIPTFKASGNVFIDNDKNRKISAGDQGYANGRISICQIQGSNCNAYETLTTDANGNFTSVGTKPLIPGQYRADLDKTNVIPPYQATTATSIIFTVGNASTGTPCTVPANTAADCTADGSGVENLNFGISDSFPWMQAIGGDITGNAISDPNGGGFTNNIPTAANVAAGICSANGAYTMLNGAGGTHGLINTGSKDANFGQGQEAAAQSWLAGGFALNYPYIYNMPLSKETRTSYANLSYLVNQSNLPNSNLNTIAGCGFPSIDCKLPTDIASFPSYIYTVDGDLNLNNSSGAYTFPDGQYVILVKGKININTQIHVSPGSFVLFSSSDNINVAATVGENTASSLASDLEGYYSTDNSFNVLSNDRDGQSANCAATPAPSPDLRLNVQGSIVVNASTINGGSFNYATRDMCALDKQCPVFTITERPDFILNAPSYLMFPRRVWQEVAP